MTQSAPGAQSFMLPDTASFGVTFHRQKLSGNEQHDPGSPRKIVVLIQHGHARFAEYIKALKDMDFVVAGVNHEGNVIVTGSVPSFSPPFIRKVIPEFNGKARPVAREADLYYEVPLKLTELKTAALAAEAAGQAQSGSPEPVAATRESQKSQAAKATPNGATPTQQARSAQPVSKADASAWDETPVSLTAAAPVASTQAAATAPGTPGLASPPEDCISFGEFMRYELVPAHVIASHEACIAAWLEVVPPSARKPSGHYAVYDAKAQLTNELIAEFLAGNGEKKFAGQRMLECALPFWFEYLQRAEAGTLPDYQQVASVDEGEVEKLVELYRAQCLAFEAKYPKAKGFMALAERVLAISGLRIFTDSLSDDPKPANQVISAQGERPDVRFAMQGDRIKHYRSPVRSSYAKEENSAELQELMAARERVIAPSANAPSL